MPFFSGYIPPRGYNTEAYFTASYQPTQGLNPPSGSQLQPVSLSGLHQKHNGVLHGECGHMLSGLNQQAEGKR